MLNAIFIQKASSDPRYAESFPRKQDEMKSS